MYGKSKITMFNKKLQMLNTIFLSHATPFQADRGNSRGQSLPQTLRVTSPMEASMKEIINEGK